MRCSSCRTCRRRLHPAYELEAARRDDDEFWLDRYVGTLTP
jgi:hypothetical protein